MSQSPDEEEATLLQTTAVISINEAALEALKRIESTTDEIVSEFVRTKIMPQWPGIDDNAKEVLVLHALNKTDNTLGPLVFGKDDPVLGTNADEAKRARFRTALALLCEKHMEGHATDAEFIKNATHIYTRQKSSTVT